MSHDDNVFEPPAGETRKRDRRRQLYSRIEDGNRVFLALNGPMRGFYFDPKAVIAYHDDRFPKKRYLSSYRLPYLLGSRLLALPFPWEDFNPGWSDYVTSTIEEKPLYRGWWIRRLFVYFSHHRECTMRKPEVP